MEVNSDNPQDEHPAGERWDPLGAPSDEDDFDFNKINFCDEHHQYAIEKIRSMEDEQELLNSSLFALTTHFAQVQFRLRQVMSSSPEYREELLKSLEEFVFRGIPDVSFVKEKMDEASLAEAVRLRRTQQRELIDRLKSQLRELEQYAFESGEAGIPQDVLLERQQVILNELKTRMNLELDEQNYHQMTPEAVKQQINIAVDQLVSPIKLKEHLVAQLKTQVADLERFIGYLQQNDGNKHQNCSCGCAYHSVKKPFPSETTLGIIQKTVTILQMFALMQLGCGVKSRFRKNDLKNTMKINHWGDLRAKLEMAIGHVKELAEARENEPSYSTNRDYSSDSESQSMSPSNIQLTAAVRKYLVPCIRDLIQHGSCSAQSNSLVPFMGCFPRRHSASSTEIHAWELILEYYHMKNGDKFNSTPARKLSQSFNLDIAGASPNSNKHNMLCAIGSIISSHSPYKRSYDSHFKAFICAALNANKLAPWVNLLFTCNKLIKEYYLPWSYVAKTGFQDSLKSLDQLTKYKFDLPVDLAVRHFQNIKDAFT
ncbi:unnamed protein product [Ceutorhynchus assimilis]|uniref:RUN domain-containing protein n=1 Tax=Ceutorhynchus assimilis TaxID=467358 RepID=A0A9N9QCN3_9CUCU|nr:unnamed protein product [Ceutorhynchus assimilis]